MEGDPECIEFVNVSSDEACLQTDIVSKFISEGSTSNWSEDPISTLKSAATDVVIVKPAPDPVLTKAARAAARKAEKEAAERRRILKGKAMCVEDSKTRRSARQAESIAKFFTTSRNASNNQPLRIGGAPATSKPPSTSSHCASLTRSLNSVSLDTQVPSSEGAQLSPKQSNGASMECDVVHEIHRHLRQDIVQVSDGEENCESDDDLEEIPPPKKAKLNYDRTRRFQNEWAAKLVWAEPIRTSDGQIQLVKCTICSLFEKNPKILGPKWDTLTKHEGKRKATFDLPKYNVKKGEWYISKTSKHQLNMRLAAAQQPASVLQQVNRSPSMALSKKIVQLSTIYQLLSVGRPMLEYEERQALYTFLNVPNLPRMHWSDSSAWKMAECMYYQVQEVVKKKINGAHFVAITCDEVTSVDNGTWICIHGYVVENYVRIHHLVSLQRLFEGSSTDTLTELIMKALQIGGNLTLDQVSSKLLSFGVDGVSTFQGARTGVTIQIKSQFAPFCVGVHCMAHRCNLAAKSLSALPIFKVIEQFVQKIHSYFSKSPKRSAEYQKLAEIMHTKGLKPLLQVQTRWVSLLEPLRRLLAEYRTLLAKMKADIGKNEVVEKCLKAMVDPYTLLGMLALMPLLETIDLLVTFAQKRDVYACDFVAALKVAEGQLYTLYVDKATAFCCDEFWAFKNVLNCSHSQIHLKWLADLNNESSQLVFITNGEKLWAKHNDTPVDIDQFVELVSTVKNKCAWAARQLLRELEKRFPSHSIMDALGVVYPQYWLQPEAEEYFPKHLSILLEHYCEPKLIEVQKVKHLVAPVLDRYSLESQQGLFKLAMVTNSKKHMEPPFDLNPLTRMWRYLDSCTVLKVKAFPEYYKLAEIAIVQVLDSVEDERCFSSLAFLKNKLRNSLDTHLECVVGMYAQKIFSLETFPYSDAYNQWVEVANQRYGL